VILNDVDSFWTGPQPVTEERLKQVFPNGMNIRTYFNRVHEINEERKSEIMRTWEVVAVVGKPPEITPAKANSPCVAQHHCRLLSNPGDRAGLTKGGSST